MKIHITAVILFMTMLPGCPLIHDTADEIMEMSLAPSDKERLRHVEEKMLRGENTIEVQIDQQILEAVKQMVVTLTPRYRTHWLRKSRLGFLEVSDVGRETVSMMHKYVTEKTMTFSFLQPAIAENFYIVERFLLEDIVKDANFKDPDTWDRTTDQNLAKGLGRSYGVDVIETGVVTESHDFLDINLRMIETRTGRIIAVGSAKIEKTRPVREWLAEKQWKDSEYYFKIRESTSEEHPYQEEGERREFYLKTGTQKSVKKIRKKEETYEYNFEK